jgi:hypothetical protein
VAFLIPLATFGTIAGQVDNIFNEIPSFGTDESLRPDPSTFVVANYTRLAEMANFYDYRFETWHIPLNFTVTTRFTTTSYTILQDYHFSDNGALWTGTSLAGFVGKYMAAKREGNTPMKDNATQVIRKLVDGMAMMLAVPNGGLGSEYGATEELWFPEWEYRGTPWTSPEQYAKWSPSMFVKNFKTPCLVIHSANDFRVPLEQGLQLFTSLQRMGVPSKLLYFPDEDHFVTKPQNAELWWKTIHEWLATYLK